MRRSGKVLAMIFVLVHMGCSSTLPGGLADSYSPADYGDFEVLGPAEGKSKGVTVFGIQTSKADLREATNEAIRSLGGDSMVNIRWYINRNWWVVLPVVTTTVIVRGDVIKYREGSDE